jgi:hypothetical protein
MSCGIPSKARESPPQGIWREKRTQKKDTRQEVKSDKRQRNVQWESAYTDKGGHAKGIQSNRAPTKACQGLRQSSISVCRDHRAGFRHKEWGQEGTELVVGHGFGSMDPDRVSGRRRRRRQAQGSPDAHSDASLLRIPR